MKRNQNNKQRVKLHCLQRVVGQFASPCITILNSTTQPLASDGQCQHHSMETQTGCSLLCRCRSQEHHSDPTTSSSKANRFQFNLTIDMEHDIQTMNDAPLATTL
eukprot:m.111806 g.111806  ORF g.111806 m.111806 type:complete len:105 (+) comp13463_c0_seq2:85-399(+)